MYLNSVTIVGFVGADPEQREARSNGSKFTILSVATQRSWKNAQDEWASKTEWHRICIFRPQLAEYVATKIKKGSHVLVEGSLISARKMRIGQNCTLHGPVVAERELAIAGGTRCGTREFPTTVSAPRIEVEEGVVVFGTLWAREHGEVVAQ